MKKPVIFAIGHSTRTIREFLGLLDAHGVKEIVDIRTIPRSRHNPQFDRPVLRAALAHAHMRYAHMKELGGLRHAKKDSVNGAWMNASFRGFADYMQTDDFRTGLRRLETEARKRPVAIMCAEGNPWRCHRSLIADALTVDGWRVLEIQSRKTAKRHERTPFLRVRRGRLTYPVSALKASA